MMKFSYITSIRNIVLKGQYSCLEFLLRFLGCQLFCDFPIRTLLQSSFMQVRKNQSIRELHNIKYSQAETIKLTKAQFVDFKKESLDQFYELKGILGEGGFGKVYEAELKTRRGCRRAIKTIQKKKFRQFRALQNEIKILTKADDPSIIKIYETFENQNHYHIVMDLCDGGQLFYFLCENEKLTENAIRVLFIQMAEAVQYCHKNKIAHRDIKPENFLILNKEKDPEKLKIKLIDFGFSYQWKENMIAQIKQEPLSQAVGTPYYVAPEILNQEGYDERCDIWSLGVILYIMVTGNPPFNGQNETEILRAVKKGLYRKDVPQLKRVSFALRDLIQKILQPIPQRLSMSEIFKHPWMEAEEISKNVIRLNFGKLYSFSRYNKLKKIAVTYIASQMSEREIMNLSELFRHIDKNHDGQLSLVQFQQCLQEQGNKISLKQIKQLISGIDLDKDGLINYTEFVSSCLENLKVFRQENMLNAFSMLDRDHDGRVSAEQLKQVLNRNLDMNAKIPEEQIKKIIKLSDKNGDGYIDFEQFQKTLTGRK